MSHTTSDSCRRRGQESLNSPLFSLRSYMYVRYVCTTQRLSRTTGHSRRHGRHTSDAVSRSRVHGSGSADVRRKEGGVEADNRRERVGEKVRCIINAPPRRLVTTLMFLSSLFLLQRCYKCSRHRYEGRHPAEEARSSGQESEHSAKEARRPLA